MTSSREIRYVEVSGNTYMRLGIKHYNRKYGDEIRLNMKDFCYILTDCGWLSLLHFNLTATYFASVHKDFTALDYPLFNSMRMWDAFKSDYNL